MKTTSLFTAYFIILFSIICSTSCEKIKKNGSFTDNRDGNEYKWVKIDKQIWMAENLNYQTSAGSWVYDNDASNASLYGRLYIWETACDVCPDGWHLASDDEWKQLEMYLGMNQSDADNTQWRGTDEGDKLKKSSGWELNNGNGSDEYGFSALPGGYYNNGGFIFGGSYALFWTSTAYDTSNAWYRSLRFDEGTVSRGTYFNSAAYSVRCIRD